jgi:sec-independent protein translocase protein TatB
MFDFGFSELVVICVVALVVLGPTRLPGLVRKVGRWVGKARAMARDFREQLENEVNLEELNRATRQPPDPAPDPPPAPAADANAEHLGGYPYGTPTNIEAPASTSARSADPAVVNDGPQPGDDDFSHAHAPGAAPEPWSPEPDVVPEPAAPAPADTPPTKPVA